VRAAILQAVGEPLVIVDDVTVLGPGPGQVKVRIRAAGVCHTDLSGRDGGLPSPVPSILGHEACGDVIETGDGVDDLAVGDRVIISWTPPCGTCKACVRGEPVMCQTYLMQAYASPMFRRGEEPVFALVGIGAFAEETVLPRAAAVKIDADVPYEVGALIGCGVMTGVGAVINTAKVEPGATVVVIGCGGVGIAAIQGARLSGASVIVAVDPVEGKHDVAKRFGATHAVHPDGLRALSKELTGGEGFDYAFEVVGLPATIRAAWDITRRGGTVIVVGAGRPDATVEFNPFELFWDGKTLRGSLYGSADVRRDYHRLLALWRTGLLDLEGMVTQRITLDEVDDALNALGRPDIIRQVIVYLPVNDCDQCGRSGE
jgi:S-(hydroxymethyl)glutathione dehydrogenase/alcohol dehydrogenase